MKTTTIKGKLFWNVKEGEKVVSCISYADTEDFYSFRKMRLAEGHRQIIVTSDIMIEIIKEFVCNRFAITDIILSEDSPGSYAEIKSILTQIESNSAYLVKLVDLLNRLAAQSFVGTPCAEIERIELKGKLPSGTEALISIQINGIVSINSEAFDEASTEISAIIKQNLFKEEVET